MKRFHTVLLTLILALALSVSVTATSETIDSDDPNTKPSVEMIANHEKNLEIVRNQRSISQNEYDMLKALESTSYNDLLEQGYSLAEASRIKNGDYGDQMLQAIFVRAKFDETTLANMGYNSAEIAQLKSLNGTESLDAIAPFAASEVTCYNRLNKHYYKTSTDRTYLIVDYGWAWTKPPLVALEDAIGCGWNQNFSVDGTVEPRYYNITNLKNISPYNGSYEYSTARMYENKLNTSQLQFKINSFYPTPDHIVLEGFGTMVISQTGRVNDAKFSFKYGHNTFAATPTVGYPWGAGFAFSGAESTFEPLSIVYSAVPNVMN